MVESLGGLQEILMVLELRLCAEVMVGFPLGSSLHSITVIVVVIIIVVTMVTIIVVIIIMVIVNDSFNDALSVIVYKKNATKKNATKKYAT